MLKIALLPNTSGFSGYTLGDNSLPRGPGSKDINNLLPAFDAMVRERHGFRAPAVEPLPQTALTYNESTVLTPEIEYGFSTSGGGEDEKAAFILGLQNNVPPVATVEFTVGQTRWYLINARLRPITVVQEWMVAIRLRFNISGGRLTSTLPAA